ncbi:hypothetical protein PanWU01x14_366300 [Parasponia andersonii]|uniref:Uncharacterized protein n=1 Tax=Parasponia andersonii TaxID=3476 RepID=A0A2P5A5Q3_PARAD|nr:hypothetical protein PanWU01x14_366300 [Parasponia andersonii]
MKFLSPSPFRPSQMSSKNNLRLSIWRGVTHCHHGGDLSDLTSLMPLATVTPQSGCQLAFQSLF